MVRAGLLERGRSLTSILCHHLSERPGSQRTQREHAQEQTMRDINVILKKTLSQKLLRMMMTPASSRHMLPHCRSLSHECCLGGDGRKNSHLCCYADVCANTRESTSPTMLVIMIVVMMIMMRMLHKGSLKNSTCALREYVHELIYVYIYVWLVGCTCWPYCRGPRHKCRWEAHVSPLKVSQPLKMPRRQQKRSHLIVAHENTYMFVHVFYEFV